MEEYVVQVCRLLDKGDEACLLKLKERFLRAPFVYESMRERPVAANRWTFDYADCSYAYVFFVNLETDEVEAFTIQFDGHTLDIRKSYECTSEFDFHEIMCMKSSSPSN